MRILLITFVSLCFFSIFMEDNSFGYGEKESTRSQPLPVGPPVISSITVKIQNHAGDENRWIEMAGDLIFFREGEPFSEDGLRKSLDALKLCKQFQKIDVDTREDGDRVVLLFSLTPFAFIKEIKIHGEHPVFEQQVLNQISIYTGEMFQPEALPGQVERLKQLFIREGYIAPKIEVTAQKDETDNNIVVFIRIDKGPYYAVKTLDISGNENVSLTRLRWKMRVWRRSLLPGSPGRFKAENLKKDIKKLLKFYWRKGYADCVIESRVEKDPEKGDVSVAINIKEGPWYKVEFIGHERFWGFTLKKDLVFYKIGNKSNFGVRKSVKNIKARYKNAGYLETRIRVEENIETDPHPSFRMLRLVIKEGPCSIVDAIRVEGNRSFDRKKIDKQMLTRLPGFLRKGVFVPEVLDDDLIAIKTLYLQQGHLDTEIRDEVQFSENKTGVAVNIDIEEGLQTIISSVKITGVSVLSSEETKGAVQLTSRGYCSLRS